jgi:2-oxoglutarate dehydrogenase E1 component
VAKDVSLTPPRQTRSFNLANSSNLAFIEQLYADYVSDPDSVSPEWRDYFEQFPNGETQVTLAPSFRPPGLFSAEAPRRTEALSAATIGLQDRVNQLIRNYRVRGHRIAEVNPLGMPNEIPAELRPEFYHFTEQELNTRVTSVVLQTEEALTVREIIGLLRDTYCRSIGVQYMHIDHLDVRRWLQRRMESTRNRVQLTRDEQLRIFTRLTDAVTFEEFIRKKFIGAKSFSLEGCESLIPLLDLAIEKAASQGMKEIVFGMAHRGRLNVLANIIGKSPRQIFREFADDSKLPVGHGDVKYHLGYSNDWTTSSGAHVHLSLCFNPSHLEFVNPVALGRVRAKQDRTGDTEGHRCMGLLIHGDASFAGQGIVQETLNMSQLPGYTVRGTLHVIVNNQIGFTTSPEEGRSTYYPSDVARMLQIPIFHVNGEDPEAVAQVVRLAMDFRHEFKRDVVIDMYGYRRLGHNESDEPSFTQPVLYSAIEDRKSVREGYLEHLLALKGVTREEADSIALRRREALEQMLNEARDERFQTPAEKRMGVWSRGHYRGGPEQKVEELSRSAERTFGTGVDSGNEPKSSSALRNGVPRDTLSELLLKQTELPRNFHPHPKITKLLETRRKMARGELPLDWSTAEALAFASLSTQGFRVRLSGQDSGRGTFSQRHAILYDHKDGHHYIPLCHLAPNQAAVDILNSPLSENGVLGFDYGYSLDCPDGLVCWEAQFGDFVNSAQVIVDQFIASAEDKWNRLSGIVLLLPHSFEGQGPEHSSARMERFLTLCAQDNMQVVYPTTPAQYFHCLRRQLIRQWRKPLVVFTPKGLLRDPRAGSSLDQCASGEFQKIIVPTVGDPLSIRRVLLCTGRIFYELEAQRQKLNRADVAIIRIEQLYPLDSEGLTDALAQYANATEAFWIQEEPENMGASRYMRIRFGERIGKLPFRSISRAASPSPATGSPRVHKKEERDLLDRAFAD